LRAPKLFHRRRIRNGVVALSSPIRMGIALSWQKPRERPKEELPRRHGSHGGAFDFHKNLAIVAGKSVCHECHDWAPIGEEPRPQIICGTPRRRVRFSGRHFSTAFVDASAEADPTKYLRWDVSRKRASVSPW